MEARLAQNPNHRLRGDEVREHLVAHTEVEEVRAGTDQTCLVIPLVGYVHGAFVVAEWASRRHRMKLLEEARAGVGEDGPME